jgi:hypothetical protein
MIPARELLTLQKSEDKVNAVVKPFAPYHFPMITPKNIDF